MLALLMAPTTPHVLMVVVAVCIVVFLVGRATETLEQRMARERRRHAERTARAMRRMSEIRRRTSERMDQAERRWQS